jgi:DNA-binding transcriptional MerR regulator
VPERMHYTVGDLAQTAGLTVRTLHHWDDIGLLQPAERSAAGHRRYSPQDVARLYRIVTLRRLGLPLEAIGAALEGEDLRAAVATHRERVEAELNQQRELHRRLTRILGAFDQLGGPSTEQLIDAIEVMTMSDRYYTSEQQATLAARAEALGPERIKAYETEWAELLAAFEREREAGTDPADPRLRPLAEKWRELIQAFTGGDAGIGASLNRMYAQEGPQRASRGGMSAELAEYAKAALNRLSSCT